MWNGCGEVSSERIFGCSLVSLDEEDLVWGCIEIFNECGPV